MQCPGRGVRWRGHPYSPPSVCVSPWPQVASVHSTPKPPRMGLLICSQILGKQGWLICYLHSYLSQLLQGQPIVLSTGAGGDRERERESTPIPASIQTIPGGWHTQPAIKEIKDFPTGKARVSMETITALPDLRLIWELRSFPKHRQACGQSDLPRCSCREFFGGHS